jgi:hypothetical protein
MLVEVGYQRVICFKLKKSNRWTSDAFYSNEGSIQEMIKIPLLTRWLYHRCHCDWVSWTHTDFMLISSFFFFLLLNLGHVTDRMFLPVRLPRPIVLHLLIHGTKFVLEGPEVRRHLRHLPSEPVCGCSQLVLLNFLGSYISTLTIKTATFSVDNRRHRHVRRDDFVRQARRQVLESTAAIVHHQLPDEPAHQESFPKSSTNAARHP